MDDFTFDQSTAQDWLNIIEGNTKARDQDVYPMLREWISQCPGTNVLEIGCGQGVCSNQIDLINHTYTGVDPSVFLLERAQQIYGGPRCRFIAGNAYQLPFQEGQFDAVFSIAVLHLLSRLDEAVQEMSRVLKPGGHFLLMTAHPHSLELWRQMYPDSEINEKCLYGKLQRSDGSLAVDRIYFHSFEEIKLSFKSNGLLIQSAKPFRSAEVQQQGFYYVAIEGKK